MDLYAQLDIPPKDRNTAIPQEEAEYLYRFLIKHGLSRTMETGFGYGNSTAHIIAATRSMHVAIDPYQEYYRKGGVRNMRKLGFDTYLRWINEPSQTALPEIYVHGATFDFAFLDGGHRYDEIFIDWFYTDLLLEEGGFIVFHDLWLRSMRMVTSFIRTNRKDYRAVRTPFPTMAAFRKVGTDRRDVNHFRNFCPGR
ncbi:MAG: class I SAM-dependent methyltransferase [Candidatus Peribacteraceae bacterium]